MSVRPLPRVVTRDQTYDPNHRDTAAHRKQLTIPTTPPQSADTHRNLQTHDPAYSPNPDGIDNYSKPTYLLQTDDYIPGPSHETTVILRPTHNPPRPAPHLRPAQLRPKPTAKPPASTLLNLISLASSYW